MVSSLSTFLRSLTRSKSSSRFFCCDFGVGIGEVKQGFGRMLSDLRHKGLEVFLRGFSAAPGPPYTHSVQRQGHRSFFHILALRASSFFFSEEVFGSFRLSYLA